MRLSLRHHIRDHIRAAVLSLLLLTAAAWCVPSFLSAERYRRQLEGVLQRRLMRQVSFGFVSYRLLPHPGFSIYNVVVKEDPRFGAEPFARIERIDCDLRWRSLWGSKLDFAQLHLQAPTVNVVRSPSGEWNLESLLREIGVASPRKSSSADSPRQGDIDLESSDARLNFKFGADKKPFAIVDLAASVGVVGGTRVRFRLEGTPVRTDVALASPGPLELSGNWTPGENLDGPLDATLGTRASLLYNWLPLLTRRNPEIYGVLDFEARLTGSLRSLRIEGQGRLNRLHRWESLPPSDSMTILLSVRGGFDRTLGRAEFESLDASFASSRLHLTGSVDKVPVSPEADLVVALERSRLEDVLALGHRLSGLSSGLGASGRIDGLVTVQGPWGALRYGGFAGARDVALHTSTGTFPVSDLNMKIGEREATLEKAKLILTPRLELGIEGTLGSRRPVGKKRRPTGPPVYELLVTAKAAALRDLVRFARGLGVRAVQDVEAEGAFSSTLRFTGTAWPLSSPTLSGSAELHAARLLLPGLAEPISFTQARVQVNGDHIVADPLVAVIGHSAFSGRVEHQGERSRPWTFNLRASNLSLDEAPHWFGVEPRRRFPLLDSIPGLRSLSASRTASATLPKGLAAEGSFATSTVVFRSATLADFRSSLELAGGTIKLSHASFRAAGGRGQGSLQVNLGESPPHLTGEATLEGAKLQAVALPMPLRAVRGLFSGSGHFQTRGSTREELASNLQGEATVRLRSVAGFDPLAATARAVSWGELEPGHPEQQVLRSIALVFSIRDRRVILGPLPVETGGALLRLSGSCGFDGTVDLGVRADFRRLTRRWLDDPGNMSPAERVATFRLSGPLDRLVVVPGLQVSRAHPLAEH